MIQPAQLIGIVRSKWLPTLLLGIFFLINITANAVVSWIEFKSENSEHLWKPWVWEISSGLVIFVMLPGVIKLLGIYPLRHANLLYHLLIYVLVAPIFSAFHIGGMVALREIAYWYAGLNYQFDWAGQNLLYEFLKDIRVFLFLLIAIESYRFIVLRLQGEASLIQDASEDFAPAPHAGLAEQSPTTHFLVKKLHKEFLIKPSSIEWVESSGNYQNLHVQGQIYPIRCTHAALLEQLGTGFFKINRCEFRGRPATHFGVNRPVISVSSGHLFRCEPVSRFGVNRSPVSV